MLGQRYSKNFWYQRWESINAVIFGLGRLNVTYEFIVRKLKFYKRLYLKSAILDDVFWAAACYLTGVTIV